MDLLPFSDISVILSDTFQCELLHQVNFIRFLQMGSLKKKNINKTTAVETSEIMKVGSKQMLIFTINFCTLRGKVAE